MLPAEAFSPEPLADPAETGFEDPAVTTKLRCVGPDDVLLDVIMADVDDVLAGMNYNEIRAGFLPTSDFSCEERRVALLSLARRPAGGKRIR